MKAKTILVLLACAALVGWMTPDLSGSSGPDGSRFPSPTAANEPAAGGERFAVHRQTSREAWLTGETVLERQPDGHFYADVSVESRPYRFLVDTGASIVALTGEDADAIGLQWSEGDLRAIGRGASGEVYGVPVVLDRIELGGFEAREVQAAIIPEGLDVSLLGQSFLAQLRGVRIDGDRMTLGGN
ncbi:aspartyl protease [Novosphingobium sp. PC22D]|uniref:retropepsin-like aspartic protease family protein n=1 Tax=Novosphingobium sp. PC22D TaxID=1962403 RepID=UPI000BF116D3|nr:TIGR02281 family clan AA aspartic protease [Novosphingobium sp. PC22D]PEQ11563.1 aspartyl protease [Novosphingobium sp. PC22D]